MVVEQSCDCRAIVAQPNGNTTLRQLHDTTTISQHYLGCTTHVVEIEKILSLQQLCDYLAMLHNKFAKSFNGNSVFLLYNTLETSIRLLCDYYVTSTLLQNARFLLLLFNI